MSLPVREVWIEIYGRTLSALQRPSLPVREVWIEIEGATLMQIDITSLPVREVWIEMCVKDKIRKKCLCHFP